MAESIEYSDHQGIQKEKEAVKAMLEKSPEKGETWFLVDSKWFSQWKRYVGYDIFDSGEAGNPNFHPGNINNSNLYLDSTCEDIRTDLTENIDYDLIPKQAWDLLNNIYGTTPGQKPIARTVIDSAGTNKYLQVEIYLLSLKLARYPNVEQTVLRKFSRMDTLASVVATGRADFKIPENSAVRLWVRSSNNSYEELDSLEETVNDASITTNQTVVIEVQNPNGSWPKDAISKRNTVAASSSQSMYEASHSSSRTVQPGLCGLNNLGNTCFMNSVLQCMSNTPPIVRYFCEDSYEDELNPTNPLGNQGEIAKAFADLLKAMWSGQHSSFAPRAFKYQVGRFAPQFYGYQQHDSQELLTFLLDGLHEDLNRIVKKPYIEMKDSDRRPDAEVAKEAWENYKKRNDSVIVDLFHGLLKSTLVCPECKKVSVTFDPTCYLSLPLPVKRERDIEVHVVRLDPELKPVRYGIIVPKNGTVRDLMEGAAKLTGIPLVCFVVTEVYHYRFHQILKPSNPLSDIGDKDVIYLYEMPEKVGTAGTTQVAVYMKEKNKKNYSYVTLFGVPFIVQVPLEGVSYDKLYQLVLNRMSRFVTPLEDGDERWSKSLPEKEEGEENSSDVEMEDIQGTENKNEESLPNGNEGAVVPYHPRYLFDLEIVSSTGTTSKKLVPDSQLVTFSGTTNYIACEWSAPMREACYDEEAARGSTPDSSLNQRVSNKKQVLQLSECLELFTSTELLGEEDAWYCPSCKKHQRATKKFDLWSLPDVLVIHLKRFSYTRFLRDKLDTLVEFPTRGLDMKSYIISKAHPPAVYDLIGVCNHFGGLGGGHYTAYARNKDNSKWYCFDDSSVSPVSEESVCSKAAYVLFYLRRGETAGQSRSLKLQSMKTSPVPVHKPTLRPRKEKKEPLSSDEDSNDSDEMDDS